MSENKIKQALSSKAFYFGTIFPSDRLVNGVDVVLDKKATSIAGVYFLIDKKTDEIVKIGESRNLLSRINTQYKCINNTTNNRIREYVKGVGSLAVYAFETPSTTVNYLDHDIMLTCCREVEKLLLAEYVAIYGEYPVLNKYNR